MKRTKGKKAVLVPTVVGTELDHIIARLTSLEEEHALLVERVKRLENPNAYP